MFSFSSGLNQISKVKLNDYNKALSGRQLTIRSTCDYLVAGLTGRYEPERHNEARSNTRSAQNQCVERLERPLVPIP
ncbi:hypothetical protein F2Q69_00031467 [Brassica cretica]|uniref:Uncharacterized protein n=1 Tax=Brassica cretica TaxID=69181 RepID=A0A8S9S7K0_BRACR|nr:hypothetical protein F2Q69_00031467 [Brassica cretica]